MVCQGGSGNFIDSTHIHVHCTHVHTKKDTNRLVTLYEGSGEALNVCINGKETKQQNFVKREREGVERGGKLQRWKIDESNTC